MAASSLSRRRLAILATATIAAGVAAACEPIGGVPGPPPLLVSVVNNHLVDGAGNNLQLRGVNRSGGEYGCVQWGGTFDGPSDDPSVAAIASWHVNAVRLGLNEDCWLGINGEPVNGLTAAQYQANIESYVAHLHTRGLYAILELHWSAPGTAKATSQEVLPDADHSPAFWSSVAAAFAGTPATIFDVFNEPAGGVSWACWRDGCPYTDANGTWQTAGMQSLVDAVRGAGARNPIMVGGLSYANDLSGWLLNKPNDPAAQMAASFHVYNFNSCNTTSCWDSTVASLAAQVPVVTGEVGESDGSTSFINTYMNWADPKGLGYLAWVWDTWGCGPSSMALVSSYDGTPCNPWGVNYQAHLAALAGLPAHALATPIVSTGLPA
jgi:hypothetical protein